MEKCAALACTASSAHSSVTTSRSCEPSASTTSRLSASAPEPLCSTTTVASACGVVRICRCAHAVASAPGPVTVTVTGSGCPSSVTTVASRNADQAAAAIRSAGVPPSPSRGSSRPTVSTVTPVTGGHRDPGRAVERRGAVVQPAQPAHRGEPPVLLPAAGHLEGVDVVGGEPLAGGRERLRPLALLGPLRARGPGQQRSRTVIRRSPPSAARSAGSAPARTPSAARGRSARRTRAPPWPSPRPRSGPGSSGRTAGPR